MSQQPTPQAISAAVREVRRRTGQRWRYQNKKWIRSGVDPATGRMRDIPAQAREKREFDGILDYFKSVHPAKRSGMGALARGLAGSLGSGVAAGAAGAAGAVGGAVGAVGRGMVGMAGAAIGAAGSAISTGIKLVTSGLSLLAGALRASVAEATAWANSMASLRANTGLSMSRGFDVVSQHAVLGIDPGRTAQIYGNSTNSSFLMAKRARALGYADPQSEGGMASLAAAYQRDAARGPMGRMRANAKLDALYGGQAPEEVRGLVQLEPGQISKQVEYQRKIQQAMRLTGEDFRKLAVDLPMAQNRVKYALQMAQAKVAIAIAPSLERLFGGIALYVGQNADKIGKMIDAGISWLVNELPKAILRGIAFFLRGAALLLRGFSTFAAGVATNAGPILQALNGILNGLTGFVNGLTGMVNNIQNSPILGPIVRTYQGVSGALGAQITGSDSKSGGSDVLNQIVGGVVIGQAGRRVALPAARFAAKKLFGGGASIAAPGAGAATGAPPLWSRWNNVVERSVTPSGKLVKPSWGGLGKAAKNFARSPKGIGAGGALTGLTLGVTAYDEYVSKSAGLPTSVQIGKYYVHRLLGKTPRAAARAAQGLAPDPVNGGQKPGPLPAANLATQPNINWLQSKATATANWSSGAAKALDGYASKADSMADNFPNVIKKLDNLIKATEDNGKKMEQLGERPISIGNDAMGRIGSYIAQDAFRLNRRRG